jgi:hypothetical protein
LWAFAIFDLKVIRSKPAGTGFHYYFIQQPEPQPMM